MILALGEQLKKLRQKHDLSQAQFANKIGVSKSMIGLYENGARSPSYDALIRIHQVFGVTIDYLFGLNENISIDITGLTDGQIQAVSRVVEQFREANHRG